MQKISCNDENFMLPLVPVMSLDSLIERFFYNKCIRSSQTTSILIEWAISKEFYCQKMRFIAQDYGNYSSHDESHSIAILDGIASVIGKKRIEKLEIMDLWLLLHCAYGHDLGMTYTSDESRALWNSLIKHDSDFKLFIQECLQSTEDCDKKNAAEYVIKISAKVNSDIKKLFPGVKLEENLESDWGITAAKYVSFLTSEYFRRQHAARSQTILSERREIHLPYSAFTVPSRFYRYVGKCALLHGESFQQVIEIYDKEWYREEVCHPAFAAAMLRLGDLLDIDNDRFDELVIKHYGELPHVSVIQKKKHESITHILYTKKKIEITSESNDIIVCNCVADWFRMLNDEVVNIIFNWNKIAPKCLGGCEMSRPNTKILYNGKEFRGTENQEFKINKNMLIDLVVGRNLYFSQLDFIKEYLQNSMDALKMKFWMELVDGGLDHFVKDRYQDKIKKIPKNEWSPFYFKKSVFQQFKLNVFCKSVRDKENHVANDIEILISDRGIGIDQECLEAISHIGSGWKKRKKYQKYLADMPDWLKPSGGFGIGMQSGFMIADKVVIQTKCEGDAKGWQIVLHSSSKSGKIEEQEYDVKHNGTLISVQIPYKWFMETKNFERYKELKFKKIGDCFDRTEILSAIFEMLKEYVEMIVGNSLFPINISCETLKPYIVNNLLPEDYGIERKISCDGTTYEIFKNENYIYLWDREALIFCRIEPNVVFDEASVLWYYKGVRVWQDMQPKDIVQAKCIGNIAIDILAKNVKNCLTIDRNQFAAEFDYAALLRKFIKVYFCALEDFGDLLKKQDKEIREISEIDSRKEYYRLMLAKRYMEDQTMRQKVQDYVSSYTAESVTTIAEFYAKEAIITDDKLMLVDITIPVICKKLWGEGVLYFAAESIVQNDEGRKKLETVLKNKDIGSVIINTELSYIMENFTGSIAMYEYSKGNFLIKYEREKMTGPEEKETILAKAFLETGKRNVFYSSNYMPELFVSEVPMEEDEAIVHNFEREGKQRIISPLSPMDNEAILMKVIQDKEDPEEAFLKHVMDREDFKLLVDWVYRHQYIPETYEKEKVIDKYGEWLKDIYMKMVEDNE